MRKEVAGKDIEVMEANEIFEANLQMMDASDLPALLQGQIAELTKLDRNVKKAIQAADAATESAKSAEQKSAGLWKKKIAIEELQSAGVDLAEAVQFGVEAQKTSFEFQTKLANISRYLFGLGISNIASNRFVVRELEMKLKGASKEELSDLAKQELMSVIKQLKEQEDVLKKQQEFSRILKKHNGELKEQFEKNLQFERNFTEQHEENRSYDKQLKTQSTINDRVTEAVEELMAHDKKQLIEQEVVNKKVTEQFQRHSEAIDKHDKQWKQQVESTKRIQLTLDEHCQTNQIHSEQLALHAKNNQEQSATLKELQAIDQLFEMKIDIHSSQVKGILEHNEKLSSAISTNVETIESQKVEIKDLNEQVAILHTQLNAKTGKSFSMTTLIFALLAFVLVIVQFLI